MEFRHGGSQCRGTGARYREAFNVCQPITGARQRVGVGNTNWNYFASLNQETRFKTNFLQHSLRGAYESRRHGFPGLARVLPCLPIRLKYNAKVIFGKYINRVAKFLVSPILMLIVIVTEQLFAGPDRNAPELQE